MDLMDLLNRSASPSPWSEGEKIPWNEPGFSARMLKEHLSQNHDAASRKYKKIDRHVEWIHRELLKGQPGKILDLACGPGLYTSRFARLGHTCVGIDYSPASIAYAAAYMADQEDLDRCFCSYILEDIRHAQYGTGFDLVMLIFGEFNVFKPEDACVILKKAFAALAPGGKILLEVHTEAAVEKMGTQKPSWYTARGGLFSEKPHLCLTESFWNTDLRVATERYFITDIASACVTRYAISTQAYTMIQYQDMLKECKFGKIQFVQSLTGSENHSQADYFVILANKN